MKLISAVLLATLCTFARADYKDAPGATQAAQTLDPLTIVTATAVNYPNDVGGGTTIDTAGYTSLSCEVSILLGNTRSVIPKCYAEAAGTNVTYVYPTMTVAAAATGRYTFDPRTSAATADTGVTDSPSALCRYMAITAASAGSGVMSCTLRR